MTSRFPLRVLPAAALGAAFILTGCMETMPHPERPGRPRPERPQACTMEYAPVCAARGHRRETFSNSCMARAKGFRVVMNGECGRDRDR